MLHELKLHPDHWEPLLTGRKTFELRRNDRGYQAGDWLVLRRFVEGQGYVDDRDEREPMIAEVAAVLEHATGLASGFAILSLGLVGFGPLLQMRLPRPVASLKNRRQLSWRKIRRPGELTKTVPTSKLSKDQNRDVDMVRRYGMVAVGRRTHAVKLYDGLPFAPDDAIRLDYSHLIEADEIMVRALRVGTLPSGKRKGQKRGTKRDLHGMIELLADALTGVWWPDDDQIDLANQRRRRDT